MKNFLAVLILLCSSLTSVAMLEEDEEGGAAAVSESLPITLSPELRLFMQDNCFKDIRDINGFQWFKWTILHVACKNNKLDLVQELLAKLPLEIINSLATYDYTALHVAVTHGCKDVIRELLANQKISKEIVNKKSANGLTAIHTAIICRFAIEEEISSTLRVLLQLEKGNVPQDYKIDVNAGCGKRIHMP